MLVRLGDRRIRYDLVGPEAAPVVCMAHSLSADSGVWSEQVPALLAEGFRVLRLDMRGHGGSDPAAGDYDMGELARDVARVLDVLGFERVHFIGLSIGGMIGQTLGITLHMELLYGQNNHHICEAAFKGFARAMRAAVEIDPRKGGAIPSTKGQLGG